MANIVFTDGTSSTSTAPLLLLQPKVKKAYFAKMTSENVEETEDYTIVSGDILSNIASSKATTVSKLIEINDSLTPTNASSISVGQVIKVPKESSKRTVSFTEIDEATMGQEVYVIVETEHLEEEIMLVNIRQGLEEILAKKDEPITVSIDGKDITYFETRVGNLCDDETIENHDDFLDWSVTKVKLEPQGDEEKKKWKDNLGGLASVKAKIYLLVDAHSNHSLPDYQSKYIEYMGYTGDGDDSKVKNLFLNQEGDWFEVEKSNSVVIRLIRKWSTDNSTTGEFTIDETDISGYILEEKGESTTVPNQDKRIPTGTFNLVWHNGTKFQNVLKLYNDDVPISRAILIHGGNQASDTEGCLLPGVSRSTDWVSGSQSKLSEINDYVTEKGIDGAIIIITEEYDDE